MYDGFGLLRGGHSSESWGTDEPMGNPGQHGCYTDAGTGLVLMTYRHYDPASARFLSRDPMGYDAGANLWSYAGCLTRI